MRQTLARGVEKFYPKKIFRMQKVYAATELGKCFVTRPSDAANMQSHFYCRVCRRNVYVLTHGDHEVLRHFQGSHRFGRDQRLSLETPGWRVLDFHGNPLREHELERQGEKIRKGPLLVRGRKHAFAEDLITDEAGVVDTQLLVLTKVSCLVDPLKMGGSYGLIKKLWAQFVLTTGSGNTEVAWTLRRSFGRFRRFPEPLRLIPDSHCCFAFSQSSLLECCPKLCRPWLVGRWLTIFTALNSRSVVCPCGPSCGHGRRALSVGLL